MNSKERVAAALARRPVDRVPVFMWFHPETAARLAHMLEIAPADVGEALGNDIQQTWVNNNFAMEGIIHADDGQGHRDVWGIDWVRWQGFNQIARFPLDGASRAEVLAYRFPYEEVDALLGNMAPVIARRDGAFIGCDVSPCVFEMYWRLRGMEGAMLDIAADPGLAATMFDRCADFAVRLAEAACTRLPLDWLWTGDDVAGQQGMLLSPRAWRKLVKPALAHVFAVGKAHGLPVAYHCCGGLRPIIGDLIEIGMDVLNPVQGNCPGMDPLELKAEFGANLAFMGGVDTQDLLPNGSVSEVRRATRRLLDGMTAAVGGGVAAVGGGAVHGGDGGGYILAASHTIPPETPDDNIFALYAEAGISREEIFDRAATLRAQRTTGRS